jgi:anionic cell wall polymer biosynthesis LytR-Cps2A-Psr (LCP) family protein
MDGFTAIWYARARHGTSDYDRMDRQRNVQEAVLKQFDPANVLSKFEAITKAGTQIVSTDIPEPMLGLFTQLAMKAKTQDVARLEIVPPTYDMDDPDFTKIHDDVKAFLKLAPAP